MPAIPVKVLAIFIICVTLCCHSTRSLAEVYRWVDENGKVHFSDKKPQDQTKQVEAVDVKAPPVIDNPELHQTMEQNRERFKALDAEREMKAKQEAKENAEKQRNKKMCGYMRRKLAAMEKSSYVYTYNKNGERVIQNDATRDKAIKDAKKFINKNC